MKLILALTLTLAGGLAFGLKGSEASKLAETKRSASSLGFLDRPRLVLVLVFDQFRADYLTRFYSRFLVGRRGERVGGFRYLMENGAYYPLAQHGVLQNMTCPGHAAILTGSYPYQNGIALNEWFDQKSGQSIYCVEDPSVSTVGAQVSDLHVGTSPKLLLGTTFGDELKDAGFKSKVATVSLKDRAAILLGGHRADLALWLEPNSFRWVSSRYYLKDGQLPGWVEKLNAKLAAEKGKALVWQAVGGGSGRSSPLARRLDPETALLEKFHLEFPHQAKAGDEASLFMPYGGQKTVEAAEHMIDAEGLGKSGDTDVLAVSFSTHDFLGHMYGPNSREMEELTISEDADVSELLNYVASHVPGGLRNTMVVLTADHGMAANPEWLNNNSVPAGRIDVAAIRNAINDMLNQKYKKPTNGDWVSAVYDLNFYLNHAAIESKHLDVEAVDQEVAALIAKTKDWQDGVMAVFTASDVRKRTLPAGLFETEILHTFFSGRSGDVLIIPKPNFIMGKGYATHMTGYSYDRTVPLVLAGRWVRPGVYSEAAQIIDVAPTLSFISGVIPPSGTEGRVLTEILGSKTK